MGFKDKFKHTTTVNELCNTENMEFKKLSDFIGKRVRLWGFFYTESKFGKQVVAVTNNCLVNLPKRAVEDFESLTDDEIEEVKNGGMILTNIREFNSKSGQTVVYEYDDTDNYTVYDDETAESVFKK